MRNLKILFSCIILSMCFNFSFAQAKLVYLNKALSNSFYLKGGMSKPINITALTPLATDPSQLLKGEIGLGYQAASQAEIGSIFYFKKMFLGKRYKLGIDWTYGFIEYTDPEEEVSFNLEGDTYHYSLSPVYGIGTKIGPCFSFNPTGRIVLDAYAKIRIAYQNSPRISVVAYDEFESRNYGYIEAESLDEFSINTGISLGANLRFGALLIGVEYNSSSIKKNYSNVFSQGEDFISNIPLHYLNLSVGLNF